MFLLQTSSKELTPRGQVYCSNGSTCQGQCSPLVTFLMTVTNTCEYSAGVKAEKEHGQECEVPHHIAYTGRKQWKMNAHFLLFIQSRMPACGMMSLTLNEGLSCSFWSFWQHLRPNKSVFHGNSKSIDVAMETNLSSPLPQCILWFCVYYKGMLGIRMALWTYRYQIEQKTCPFFLHLSLIRSFFTCVMGALS